MEDVREQPTIDILMATFNGEKFLADQLDSILAQTFREFRLIVADDCSTDSTRDILQRYATDDPRIELWANAENLGVKANFELLLTLSSAPYFMLSDQDDIWHEDKVKLSLEYIRSSEALLCYSDLRVVDVNRNRISDSFWRYEKIKPCSGSPWKTLLSQNFVTGCTVIARHELIRYSVPFPADITMHDGWLALCASVFGQLSYIDKALIDYRQHYSNEIGARGFGSQFISRSEMVGKEYDVYLANRNRYFSDRIQILEAYLEHFSKSEEIPIPQTLGPNIRRQIKLLQQSIRVRWVDLRLRGFLLKFVYSPSQGTIRNFWWAIYLSVPMLAYVILRLFAK